MSNPNGQAPRGNVLREHPVRTGVAVLMAGLAVGAGVFLRSGSKAIAEGSIPTATRFEPKVTITGSGEIADPNAFDCATDIDGSAELRQAPDGTVLVESRILSTLPVRDGRTQYNRLWSNSVANPVVNDKDAQAAKKEMQTTICEDPGTLAATGNALANDDSTFGPDKKTLAKLNPWLAEKFGGPASNIDDIAEAMTGQPTDTDEETVAKAKNRLLYAAAVNTLLDQMRPKIMTVQTREMTRLRYGGMELSIDPLNPNKIDIPEFERTARDEDQYRARTLAFVATQKEKDATCEDIVFGKNLDDQRPLEVDCDEGKAKKPPVVTHEEPGDRTPPPPPARTTPPTGTIPSVETTPPPAETTPEPPADKRPKPVTRQSIPGAPGSGGEGESGDGRDDSDDTGYGVGDTPAQPTAPPAVPADNPPATSIPSPVVTTPVAPREPVPGVTQTVTITPPATTGGPEAPQD